MSNGWTSERKAKQAAAIQNWRPWTRATGPKTSSGKARVARNAFKGGSRPALRADVQTLKLAMATQSSFLHGLDV